MLVSNVADKMAEVVSDKRVRADMWAGNKKEITSYMMLVRDIPTDRFHRTNRPDHLFPSRSAALFNRRGVVDGVVGGSNLGYVTGFIVDTYRWITS